MNVLMKNGNVFIGSIRGNCSKNSSCFIYSSYFVKKDFYVKGFIQNVVGKGKKCLPILLPLVKFILSCRINVIIKS